MSKFRKKPIVIEAYQATYVQTIDTLEGVMVALPGDWIITGVNGERYPCKPDIFEKTYAPADELPNADHDGLEDAAADLEQTVIDLRAKLAQTSADSLDRQVARDEWHRLHDAEHARAEKLLGDVNEWQTRAQSAEAELERLREMIGKVTTLEALGALKDSDPPDSSAVHG